VSSNIAVLAEELMLNQSSVVSGEW